MHGSHRTDHKDNARKLDSIIADTNNFAHPSPHLDVDAQSEKDIRRIVRIYNDVSEHLDAKQLLVLKTLRNRDVIASMPLCTLFIYHGTHLPQLVCVCARARQNFASVFARPFDTIRLLRVATDEGGQASTRRHSSDILQFNSQTLSILIYQRNSLQLV